LFWQLFTNDLSIDLVDIHFILPKARYDIVEELECFDQALLCLRLSSTVDQDVFSPSILVLKEKSW